MMKRMFIMRVYKDGQVLVTRETSCITGVIEACESWTSKGYEVKLFRQDEVEIDWT